MSRFFSFLLGVGFSIVCLFVLANVPTLQDKYIEYVNNQRQEVEVEDNTSNTDPEGVESLPAEDEDKPVVDFDDIVTPAAFTITRG